MDRNCFGRPRSGSGCGWIAPWKGAIQPQALTPGGGQLWYDRRLGRLTDVAPAPMRASRPTRRTYLQKLEAFDLNPEPSAGRFEISLFYVVAAHA